MPEPIDVDQTQGDLGYWVGFHRIPKVGSARIRALLDHFGDLEYAWRATARELATLHLPQDALEEILHWRPNIDIAAELHKIEQAGVSVLTWQDPEYPERLREIDSSPPVLYVRGTLTEADHWSIGVVGTRGPTSYGKEVTRRLCAGLAEQGLTVISGLALGIDGVAHRAALDAGGRTIAVLGCGVDIDYPSRHTRLADRMAQQGAVISEYALGAQPVASNFPPRNRIISGLSLGTLVVEAGERSGSLITLRYALEQGRETFCVPGNIFSKTSAGTNAAIQRGEAKLVATVEDILVEINLTRATQQREVQLTLPDDPVEISLLACLEAEPLHIDEIARRLELPAAAVSSALCMLELKGLARRVDNMSYVAAH